MRLGGRNKRPLGERAAHAREHGGNAAGKHDRDGLKRQCEKSLLLFESCGLQHAGTWTTIASGRHLAVGHSGSGWRRTLQLRGCEASACAAGASAQQAPSPHDISMLAGFHSHLLFNSPIHYLLSVQF